MTFAPSNIIKRRPSGVVPKCELRDFAKLVAAESPSLDLIHVTTVGAAERIISDKQINATLCSVFNETLVYFFVGRPAYKTKAGEKKSDQISRFPSVFIADPATMGSPHRVFPFDTGAAVSGRYDSAADPYVWLDDYELDPEFLACRKHITWAFGDNVRYFEGELKYDLDKSLERWNLVAQGYIKIAQLSAIGATWPDKRASAIEVAYGRHISLRDHVRLIILPKQFVEGNGGKNDSLLSALKRQKIDWMLYDWRPYEAPDYYEEQIHELTKQYLISKGQL